MLHVTGYTRVTVRELLSSEKRLLVIYLYVLMPSIAAILVLFQVVAFIGILAYPTPVACLVMATTPLTLLAAVTIARTGGGALAASNLVEVYELCLCIILQGQVLMRQLDLPLHNRMELVVPAPPGIGNRLERERYFVGHCHSFRCARTLILEVDLLGFSPVVPVRVGLNLVFVKGLHDLLEQADLDVWLQVLASHDGAKVLHREMERVNRTAPPYCVAVL